jgi:hypothetical protein
MIVALSGVCSCLRLLMLSVGCGGCVVAIVNRLRKGDVGVVWKYPDRGCSYMNRTSTVTSQGTMTGSEAPISRPPAAESKQVIHLTSAHFLIFHPDIFSFTSASLRATKGFNRFSEKRSETARGAGKSRTCCIGNEADVSFDTHPFGR